MNGDFSFNDDFDPDAFAGIRPAVAGSQSVPTSPGSWEALSM